MYNYVKSKHKYTNINDNIIIIHKTRSTAAAVVVYSSNV